jgi:hypothetical protein
MHRTRPCAHAIRFGLRPTASPPTTSATLACDEHPPRDRVRASHPRLRAHVRIRACMNALRARAHLDASECVSG